MLFDSCKARYHIYVDSMIHASKMRIGASSSNHRKRTHLSYMCIENQL